MRPPRRTPPSSLPLLAALALSAVAAASCGEPSSTEDGRRTVPEPREEETGGVMPASYRTEVAFVPHGDGPSAYLRLDQTARTGSLARGYRGWTMEGGDVRTVLSVDDTLPTPRAAWRPLPASGLRVVADRNGRLRTLVLDGPDRRIRLTVDSALRDWTGPTGQPERLAAARAVREGDIVPGLLLERRRARPLDLPGPEDGSALLLVAGPGPVGAAVLLMTSGGDSTTIRGTAAHGLTGDGPRSWDEPRIRRTPADTAGWTLELGEAGETELRLGPAVGLGPRPIAVEGTLTSGGRGRPVTGIIVRDPEG